MQLLLVQQSARGWSSPAACDVRPQGRLPGGDGLGCGKAVSAGPGRPPARAGPGKRDNGQLCDLDRQSRGGRGGGVGRKGE